MKKVSILALSALMSGLFTPWCKSEVTQPESDDETLTWGELISEIKTNSTLKEKTADATKELFPTASFYSSPTKKEALFDKFISGIIQDAITAHLLANIIKQKVENTKGPLENPEEMRTQKNESMASIESITDKNLKDFCEIWRILAGKEFSRTKLSSVKTINKFVIPAIRSRIKLIIKLADEILKEDGIKDGYKKIYGHIYKNIAPKGQSEEATLNKLSNDLANIYATYFYEVKKPKKINPEDVLQVFHFSWLKDLYQPTFKTRKASTLFTEEQEVAEEPSKEEPTPTKKTKPATRKKTTSTKRIIKKTRRSAQKD